MTRQNLTDELTGRIVDLIRSEEYGPGDRLPPIGEMARCFGVGHPSLREALKKLEGVGVVRIKHGSGVYVDRGHHMLLVSNPVCGSVSKKILEDLIAARIPIETTAAGLAAVNATEEQLERMAELLADAERNLDNATLLNKTNMAFHREIAIASANVVLAQLHEVLTNLFQNEQRLILDIHGSRERDHEEHLDILCALRARDVALAVDRIRTHLEGVAEALRKWDPDKTPVHNQAVTNR